MWEAAKIYLPAGPGMELFSCDLHLQTNVVDTGFIGSINMDQDPRRPTWPSNNEKMKNCHVLKSWMLFLGGFAWILEDLQEGL
jgi:hypothetical protein